MSGRQRVSLYGLAGHLGAIAAATLMHHGWLRDVVGLMCSVIVGSALSALSGVRNA